MALNEVISVLYVVDIQLYDIHGELLDVIVKTMTALSVGKLLAADGNFAKLIKITQKTEL